jgi:hypothetical protein
LVDAQIMILVVGIGSRVTQAATSSDSYSIESRPATEVVYRPIQTIFTVSSNQQLAFSLERVSGNVLSWDEFQTLKSF